MRRHLVFDNMDSSTGWTAFNSDTTNVAASSCRIFGTYSMEFDKANGAANTTSAIIYKTDTSNWATTNLSDEEIRMTDRVMWSLYVSDLTNISLTFLRLGVDASNYIEWRVADSLLIAGWNACDVALGKAYLGGTGWDPSAIAYAAVGVTFDGETNALADIKVDQIAFSPVTLSRTAVA